jgi:hypothetical protein
VIFVKLSIGVKLEKSDKKVIEIKTARILGFNDKPRLPERQLLINKKKYPTPEAIKRMNN